MWSVRHCMLPIRLHDCRFEHVHIYIIIHVQYIQYMFGHDFMYMYIVRIYTCISVYTYLRIHMYTAIMCIHTPTHRSRSSAGDC